jgi:uncharacterized membrane protein YfcA
MNLFEIEYIYLFLLILPFISFLYASVGHGGASGYLAMMALFSFAPETMKPTALLLNLFVAAISFYYYYRNGFFNKKIFLPFAITSIPFAFLGGRIEVDASIYKIILGVLLIFAILKLLNAFGKKTDKETIINIWLALVIGCVIGFISGLIGIGGGIILTPIILLLNWGKMKEAAAVSALFIWVNSASGMLGQITIGIVPDSQSFLLVGIALIGATLGGYFGSKKINNKYLRYLLIFVLATASLKLFLTSI